MEYFVDLRLLIVCARLVNKFTKQLKKLFSTYFFDATAAKWLNFKRKSSRFDSILYLNSERDRKNIYRRMRKLVQFKSSFIFYAFMTTTVVHAFSQLRRQLACVFKHIRSTKWIKLCACVKSFVLSDSINRMYVPNLCLYVCIWWYEHIYVGKFISILRIVYMIPYIAISTNRMLKQIV